MRAAGGRHLRFGMIVLGIETSCDETAAAVVGDRPRPEIRRQPDPLASSPSTRPMAGWCRRSPRGPTSSIIDAIVAAALARPASAIGELDGVAAAAGPGLIGGLIVGLVGRQGGGLGRRQAVRRGQPPGGPCAGGPAGGRRRLSLSAAAGLRRPCQLLVVRRRRATTAGWARPSTTRPARPSTRSPRCSAWAIPAGRRWSALAASGDPARFALPRPLQGREGCDFSFSGPEDRGARRSPRSGGRSGRRTRRPRRRGAGRDRDSSPSAPPARCACVPPA